jgi:hypothetical protein
MKHLKRLEEGAKVLFWLGLLLWAFYAIFYLGVIGIIAGSLYIAYFTGKLIED